MILSCILTGVKFGFLYKRKKNIIQGLENGVLKGVLGLKMVKIEVGKICIVRIFVICSLQ
jgi:hypothetical protein